MKRWLMRAALAGLLAAAVPSHADEGDKPKLLPAVEAPPPALAAGPGCLDGACAAKPGRTLSLPKMALVERETETAIPRWIVKDLIHPGVVLAPEVKFKEEKRIVTFDVLKPREELREITSYVKQSVEKCDPVTGHKCMVDEYVPVPKTVKVTVYDTVPESKQIIVQVPVVTFVPREIDVITLGVYPTSVPGVCKRLELVTHPNEVAVPACRPLPPPPPPPCVQVGVVKPPPPPAAPCCGKK